MVLNCACARLIRGVVSYKIASKANRFKRSCLQDKNGILGRRIPSLFSLYLVNNV